MQAATSSDVETKVLVVGARGVGIETCKNLVLTGFHGKITLHDPEPACFRDLGANFLLTEEVTIARPEKVSRDMMRHRTWAGHERRCAHPGSMSRAFIARSSPAAAALTQCG